jgi:hypothetical protein
VFRYVLKVYVPGCLSVNHAFFDDLGERLSKLLFGEQPRFLLQNGAQFMRGQPVQLSYPIPFGAFHFSIIMKRP